MSGLSDGLIKGSDKFFSLDFIVPYTLVICQTIQAFNPPTAGKDVDDFPENIVNFTILLDIEDIGENYIAEIDELRVLLVLQNLQIVADELCEFFFAHV